MNILSIETSCDETALSVIELGKDWNQPNFSVKSNLVISQIAIHEAYGGVFPALAKREHAENLVPLLLATLTNAELLQEGSHGEINSENISQLLEREPTLATALTEFVQKYQKPNIDFIMVTYGPGLTPALWVGVNFARALSLLWNIPVLPVNHMEGHLSSILLKDDYMTANEALYTLDSFQFPMLALLISGGHTQLILIRAWGDYQIIGETVDDAVGEAFDKVARMLGMTYPGGPKIYSTSLHGKTNSEIKLPRPMITTNNYQFSFSGLKTAVRYLIEAKGGISNIEEQSVADIAKEFQQSVTDVLLAKTRKAMIEFQAQGLIIAGGVAANQFIRTSFEEMIKKDFEQVRLFFPERKLCGDNSLMIASAGFLQYLNKKESAFVDAQNIVAVGNLKL